MDKNFQKEIFRELEIHFSPPESASSDIEALFRFFKFSN